MLMTTFSKHRLIGINMACVYIMPELTKKDGEGMTVLIADEVNLIYQGRFL